MLKSNLENKPTNPFSPNNVNHLFQSEVTLTEDGWWSVVAAGWGEFGEAATNGGQSWSSGHT